MIDGNLPGIIEVNILCSSHSLWQFLKFETERVHGICKTMGNFISLIVHNIANNIVIF